MSLEDSPADPVKVRQTVDSADILDQLKEFGSNISILATIPSKQDFWDDPVVLSTALVIREKAKRSRLALQAQLDKAREDLDDLKTRKNHYTGNAIEAENRLNHYEDRREPLIRAMEESGSRGKVSVGRVSARSPERRLAELDLKIREEKESLYRARTGLEATTVKLEKVQMNFSNMEFLHKHFMHLYNNCFVSIGAFTDEVLRGVAEKSRNPTVVAMLGRLAEVGLPNDLSTIPFDWPEFIRRFDMFLVRNIVRIQGSIVAPRKETLIHIRKQQLTAAASIKAHFEARLRHKKWRELGELLVDVDMMEQLDLYQMFSDRVRVYFMVDAIQRVKSISSNRLLQLIFDDILEFMSGDISRGFSTFGKDAGFNPLMRKIGGFYVLYQWRSVNLRSVLPSHPDAFAQINLIHVYDAGVMFVDSQGAEVDHPLHPEARQLLKDIGRELLYADAEREATFAFGF